MPGDKRPEKGLLRLRAGMGLYANNRPAKIWPQLAAASPLKAEIVAKGIDFIVVRELIGGVYFGEHKTYEENGEKVAVDTMPYAEHEIERIGRIGFETAMKRRKKLTCVDKANVLDTSRLWRASCIAWLPNTRKWNTARCSSITAPCRSARTRHSLTLS